MMHKKPINLGKIIAIISIFLLIISACLYLFFTYGYNDSSSSSNETFTLLQNARRRLTSSRLFGRTVIVPQNIELSSSNQQQTLPNLQERKNDDDNTTINIDDLPDVPGINV